MKDLFVPFREAITDRILNLEAECTATLTAMKSENDALKSKLAEANKTLRSGDKDIRANEQDWQPSQFVDWHPDIDDMPSLPRTSREPKEAPIVLELCVRPHKNKAEDKILKDIPKELGVQSRADIAQQNRSPSHMPKACEEESGADIIEKTKASRTSRESETKSPLTSPPTSPSTSPYADVWESVIRRAPGSTASISCGDCGGKLCPLDSWGKFFIGLTTPKELRPEKQSMPPDCTVEVRRCWLLPYTPPQAASELGKGSFYNERTSNPWNQQRSSEAWNATDSALTLMRVGFLMKNDTFCMQRFTVHPESKLSILNALIQCILIAFDVVDFPLMVFYTEESPFASHMMLISACFWTYAMLFSFLEGFYTPHGVIEMRPCRIARHYARGWFVFDFVLIAIDWFFVIAIYIQGNAGSREARLARAAKIRRAFRAGRIIRLAKTVEKGITLLDATAGTEWMMMCAKIMGIMLIILTINHYIACTWYGVAQGSDLPLTWVKVEDIEDGSIFDKYFYSLHWAITQFTPCTQNISPANSMERFFACFVGLFALVVFSAFMSTLTSAIMQVKKLNFQRYNEQVQIRDFLHRKKVPLSLANRIWHHYRTHYTRRNKLMTEADITFFQLLPKGLINELRNDVYLPVMIRHPLLKELMLSQSYPLCELLIDSAASITPVGGQDIFMSQELATHMYYVINGVTSYNYHGRTRALVKGEMVAEAVLWLQDWQHRGSFTVVDNQCELLPFDAMSFVSSFEKVKTEHMLHVLRRYASMFAQQMQDNLDHFEGFASVDLDTMMARCSDLSWDRDELRILSAKAATIHRASNKSSVDSYEAPSPHPLRMLFNRSLTFFS